MSERLAYAELNQQFDNAMVQLREHYINEIQDLRKLYSEADRKVKELEGEIQILKGEQDEVRIPF